MSCCRGQAPRPPEHVIKVEKLEKPPENPRTGKFISSIDKPKIVLSPVKIRHS